MAGSEREGAKETRGALDAHEVDARVAALRARFDEFRGRL